MCQNYKVEDSSKLEIIVQHLPDEGNSQSQLFLISNIPNFTSVKTANTKNHTCILSVIFSLDIYFYHFSYCFSMYLQQNLQSTIYQITFGKY